MPRRTRVIDPSQQSSIVTSETVIRLTDRSAADPLIAGAKAANLATAAALGLPVLPGAVLTIGASLTAPADIGALHDAWRTLSENGAKALVVRSSSSVEDAATSSMAGVFTSVLDVAGWPALLEAIQAVLASAQGHPMAVLLQPMLDAAIGGVLFGVDPVGGRTDRLLVEWVKGGPAPLVGGLVSGSRLVLSRHGRIIERDRVRSLDLRSRHDLAGLARAAEAAFGAPQDIEWAVDGRGHLWLLQSRPVTAASRQGSGPTFGPGPVAETFPAALAPLEEDLWVEPLRSGIRAALEIAGGLPRRALRRSPIVVSVNGHVAGDLDLLGMRERPAKFLARLDPRPPARRLAIAWRVGRLRRALPLLAGDVVTDVDRRLREVPPLSELTDDQLLTLLSTTSATLHGVHGHEVLAGILGDAEGTATGAAAAMAAIARRRATGESDADIVALDPVVLALSAPAIGVRSPLPEVAITGPDVDDLGEREALRLRARWLHELAARAAFELGRRLSERGVLGSPEKVRYLTRDELSAVVAGGRVPDALATRAAATDAAPLPAAFRLDDQGAPVPIVGRRGRRLDGRGAGGGRGIGIVHDRAAGPPPAGSVLIVQALEPGLAALLPGLSGIVAETGSVLSHLAILAREVGVPTVVAVEGAVDRFPPGSRVLVDGNTGEVTMHEGEIA